VWKNWAGAAPQQREEKVSARTRNGVVEEAFPNDLFSPPAAGVEEWILRRNAKLGGRRRRAPRDQRIAHTSTAITTGLIAVHLGDQPRGEGGTSGNHGRPATPTDTSDPARRGASWGIFFQPITARSSREEGPTALPTANPKESWNWSGVCARH